MRRRRAGMAEWILRGDPGLDLWAFDIRRSASIISAAAI
jgi:hypothetical protein